MDRSYWYWIFLICGALIFSGWRSLALEKDHISYVSQSEKNLLKSDFDTARPLSRLSGTWVCDMYGVSSSLQVMKGIPLYKFELVNGHFQNHGAQANSVPVYKTSNGEMIGSGIQVTDQIRQTKDGQLLSRLTHDGQAVAYSRCRPG